MVEPRLPAHLEAAGLIRRTHAAGGFAAVLHKGERDAGPILVIARENGTVPRLYERLPSLAGGRPWTLARTAADGGEQEFEAYSRRRTAQDPDTWLIELDIPHAERLIGFSDERD